MWAVQLPICYSCVFKSIVIYFSECVRLNASVDHDQVGLVHTHCGAEQRVRDRNCTAATLGVSAYKLECFDPVFAGLFTISDKIPISLFFTVGLVSDKKTNE